MDTTHSSSLPLLLSIIKTFVAEGARILFRSAAAGMIGALTANCLHTIHSLIQQRPLQWADMGSAGGGDAWPV